MTEEKLKPRPACGNAGVLFSLREGDKAERLSCSCIAPACHFETGNFLTSTEAIAAWNRRPLEDAKDARIAELEKQLKERDTFGIIEVMVRNPNVKSFVEEHEKRIEKLERQLAEATTWRSPETAPTDGTWFRAKFDDDCEAPARFADDLDQDEWVWRDVTDTTRMRRSLVGWRECANPLPETKKEDV